MRTAAGRASWRNGFWASSRRDVKALSISPFFIKYLAGTPKRVRPDAFSTRLNVASNWTNDTTRMWWLAAATHGWGSVAGRCRTKRRGRQGVSG